ncbi:TPA: hypothetical protein DEP94_01115 [Candidatus Nomurabacteria bacterium]|nr:hypothetical protein [Candidatus Nomurabacteria bacterium]
MAIPNIDTFEQDIRDEIKHKEASITDIASASGDVGNNPTLSNSFSNPNSSRGFFISAIVILLLVIAGFSYLAYLYVNQQKPITKDAGTELINTQSNNANTQEIISQKLNNYSPTLATGIAHFTTKVENNSAGIILTINDYNSVFAFMIKNETDIAKDVLANELKNYENSTTTPDLTFIDDTKSNQNMRGLTINSSTLVYAFINDEYLVFASSTDGILQMRGTIIK